MSSLFFLLSFSTLHASLLKLRRRLFSAAIGAFAIGLGGTLWSRLARGTAYTSQSTAILMLVPNGLAAAGGIAMTTAQGSTSFEMGTQIALRQIEIAIGITSEWRWPTRPWASR